MDDWEERKAAAKARCVEQLEIKARAEADQKEQEYDKACREIELIAKTKPKQKEREKDKVL